MDGHIQTQVDAHRITPRRRQHRFDERLDRDFAGEAYLSRFLGSLSVAFPEGEKFFVESVRRYKDRIDDPQLLEDVRAFVTQEALHSREHQKMNDWLASLGYPIGGMERVVVGLLGIARRFPPLGQLAVTCSLEHCTAILGEMLLEEPALLDRLQGDMKKVWAWHAIEEVEHKAVAYDVWEAQDGPYALRAGIHLLATAILMVVMIGFAAELVRRDGRHLEPRVWTEGFQTLFGRPGHLRGLVPRWARYFRPDFHPRSCRDRHTVAEYERMHAASLA